MYIRVVSKINIIDFKLCKQVNNVGEYMMVSVRDLRSIQSVHSIQSRIRSTFLEAHFKK